MITVFVVAFSCALALLLLNTLRAEQSFTLTKLRSDVTTLGDREQALNSEIDAVSAPQSLAMKANEYGLKPATSVTYKSRSTGKTLGTTGAVGATKLGVNTLPDTPATRVATSVLDSGTIGLHITDPVEQARKDAADKAKADAAKRADEAKRKAEAAAKDDKSAASSSAKPSTAKK